jgi:glycine cleavage system H protein
MSFENVKFTKTHEWVKVEGTKAFIGITDYAQNSLGSVVFVDLPSVGQVFKMGSAFGAIESVKAASDLMMPISGKVTSVNESLSDEPEKLNLDAFGNFIIEIEVLDRNELEGLLDYDAYQQII